jgi:tetratricopeptide (TPR) repeat protein
MPVVVVFSRWGKVVAATTATHLISDCSVDEILFTGVAGAAQPGLKVGDVVVGARLWQHNMDARSLFLRHEIPLLGQTSFASDAKRRQQLLQAAAPMSNLLATNDLYIGWLLYQMGRFDEALDSLGRARHIWNQLVEDRPKEYWHWYRRNQSFSYCTTAEVLLDLEQPDDALEWLKEARAIAEPLVQEQPGDDRYSEHLAYVDYLLGTLHHACG